jgi:hypothetical protein
VAGLQVHRPLGVDTPRAVSALAIPASVVTPTARISATTGRRSAARAAAFADFAAAARRFGLRLAEADPAPAAVLVDEGDAARLQRRAG